MNIQDRSATSQEIGTFGLAVAGLLGVSTTIVGYFDRLWVGLLVALGGIIAVAFFTAVGRHLLPKAAKPTADWVHNSLAKLFSGYKSYYLRHAIEFEHRNFDVKGLSTQNIYTLELQHVFVDLSLAPMAPHEATGNPIEKLPEALQAGRHSVWRYLEPLSGEPQHLAVLGAPGSGKTTLMKHMALSLALKGKGKPSAEVPDLLPVLLFLRDHAATIKSDDEYSLIKAIDAEISHLSDQQPPPPGWFEGLLSSGRCLILLDGLDEVADPTTRRKVVNWVEKQMQAHGRNAFVITSRPFGYRDNPLSGVTVLDVRPFTAAQVERFILNWYLANEIKAQQREDEGVQRDAERGAKDLLSRLWGTPALSDLAVNPLLLTMIATVHRYRSSLPGRRVELYAEICEVFLGKRSQGKGLQLDLTPAQRQTVLEPLAFQMMRHRIREIDEAGASKVIAAILKRVGAEAEPGDFLMDTQNNSGLLIERENGVYAFAHLTFQEFLAAAHIQKGKLEKELTDNIVDSWWHETIRLYAAQADASPIIEACIGYDPIQVPALVLAIECQEEAKEITPSLRERLTKVLSGEVDANIPEKSTVISEALLTLRLKRLIRIDDSRYIDASLISNAEYQLFLDDIARKGKVHKPDHWSGEHYLQGQGQEPILGVRYEDAVAFCEWLTEREGQPWIYRLPRSNEVTVSRDREDPSSGYWISTDGESGFAHAVKGEERQPLRLAEVVHDFALHCAFHMANGIIRAIDIKIVPKGVLDLAHNLARYLDLATHSAGASHSGHKMTADLTRIRDRILNLTGDHGRFLAQDDIDSARGILSALIDNLASALQLGVTTNRDHVDDDRSFFQIANRATAIVETLASDLGLVNAGNQTLLFKELANELDLVSDIVSARALADDLARAGKSERTSDLDVASAYELAEALASLKGRQSADTLREFFTEWLPHGSFGQPLQQVARILEGFLLRDLQVSQQSNAKEKRLRCLVLTAYLIWAYYLTSVSLGVMNWPTWKQLRLGINIIGAGDMASSVTVFGQALEQIEMLRQRIDRDAQPFEGIRIVRERRKEEHTAA